MSPKNSEVAVAQRNFNKWVGRDLVSYATDETTAYCKYCDGLFVCRESTVRRHSKAGTKPCCPTCRGERAAQGTKRKLQKEALV